MLRRICLITFYNNMNHFIKHSHKCDETEGIKKKTKSIEIIGTNFYWRIMAELKMS